MTSVGHVAALLISAVSRRAQHRQIYAWFISPRDGPQKSVRSRPQIDHLSRATAPYDMGFAVRKGRSMEIFKLAIQDQIDHAGLKLKVEVIAV